MELQLIQLYSWVCLIYDKHPSLKYQRLSNNWQPLFTDQELITVYLFGHLQGHFNQNRIHQYIEQHFRDWFPELPAYQSFNYRLNNLAESLQVIVYELFEEINGSDKYHFEEDCLIDSMPIMLAVRGRSYRAKVARDEANQSYCATKEIWYHGVKLHLVARRQYKSLPKPEILKITAAAEHDLRVLQELEGYLIGNIFADKAYKDTETEHRFKEQGVNLCTPDKKKKKQEVYEVGHSGLWSRFVSTIRQPIESLFNWINEKTKVQNGSKIRSSKGLLAHCYGKLAAALYFLCFNS
jgi:DDE family transposase